MSDTSQGDGWWVASDSKWYPPEQHPDYVPLGPPSGGEPVMPVMPVMPTHGGAAETVAIPAAGGPITSPNPGPAFTPPGAATQTYSADTPVDPHYNLPAAEQPSSSKRSLMLGIGALVLVAGLGFLAFRFFNGASAAGGADSPDAAVAQLIASVNERDAVGFVDVFDPDEIDAWFGSFAPAFEAFEEIDADGGSTNEISQAYASVFESFDYTITGPDGDDLTYEVEPLDENGRISRVRVEGLDFELMLGDSDTSIIGAFGDDPSAVNLSELDGTRAELRDERGGLAARIFVPGERTEDDFAPDFHMDLVTVQKDGKWFVSIGYTALEAARNQGEFDGLPRPDFGRAFTLVDDQTGGAESPEAVVQAMFDAFEALDYETLIQLTDPYGTPYLHDYQPLIDAEVDETERRDAVRDASLRFDALELGTAEWEGRTLVTTADISGTSSGTSFAIDTSIWCVNVSDGFDEEEVCLEDGISELLFEIDSDLDPRDLIPDQTGFIVVERNGRWFLDPLGTMGFYTDQLAEVSATLTEEFQGSAANEIGDFFLVEGPVARQGVPVVTQAQSGSAGVALDLSGYPTINSDFAETHVAVARVVTDQPGTFVSYDNLPLTGEDWVVAYDSGDSPFEFPAIGANIDGSLDVELFEVQVTEVGNDGFTGQLGGQGRPQVFVFADETSGADRTVSGAFAESVFAWDLNGVVLDRRDSSSSITGGSGFISGGSDFTVVFGEPGAPFTINVDFFEAEPEPEPEPESTPEPVPTPTADTGSDLGDAAADAFANLVEPSGYTFSDTQAGGYFDGCGGPDDPDVTSYLFDDFDGALMILTQYPTPGRAEAAFDSLVNLETPCDTFADLNITEIVTVDLDNIRVAWQFEGDTVTNYEHYRLVGDAIVVAANTSLSDLDGQIEILDNW